MNPQTNNNLISDYRKFQTGEIEPTDFRDAIKSADKDAQEELRKILSEATNPVEEGKDLEKISTSKFSENGEVLPEIISLKEYIADYQKLKEDIAANEQKLKDFPANPEEKYRQVFESLINNKSNEPGNITLTEKRNLLRGATTDAEKGLSLLDELNDIRKELKADNQDLEKIDGQIRSTVSNLPEKLNTETLAQIEKIANSLSESFDGIKELLLNLLLRQKVISNREPKKEILIASELKKPDLPTTEIEPTTNISGIEDVKAMDAPSESFEVEGGDEVEGESESGEKTEADDFNNIDEENITVNKPAKVDRKKMENPDVGEYSNFVDPPSKPAEIDPVNLPEKLIEKKDHQVIEDLDGATDAPKNIQKNKPEPEKLIQAQTPPVGMMKIGSDGKTTAIETGSAQKIDLKDDLNIPKPAGQEQIERIKQMIGENLDGKKVEPVVKVEVSDEKKSKIQDKLKQIVAKEAMAGVSIEDQLLAKTADSVDKIEGPEDETGTDEKILAEDVSENKNAVEMPAENIMANNSLPTEPVKSASENSIIKPVEPKPEKKKSIFSRFNDAMHGLGNDPKSDEVAKRLGELQQAHKTELEKN